MKNKGYLVMSALSLITLAMPACKKEETPEKLTDCRFKFIFKHVSIGGSAISYANWGIATNSTDLFNLKFVDEGKTNATGMDTTKQLQPGKYHLFAWGKLNDDSVSGISAENDINYGKGPKELMLFLK